MVIKAKKETILLGNIELDVYELPDGTYRWSKNQASLVLGFNRGWIRNALTRGGETAEALTAKGFSNEVTEVKADRSEVQGISTEDFMALISYAAFEVGKPEAIALAQACFAEALERRADSAFQKTFTETERNQRISNRIITKDEFHPVLTAAIQEYCRPVNKLEWARYIKEFQDRLNIRSGTRNELSVPDLMRLATAQRSVATLLIAGLTWEQALNGGCR